MKRGLIIVVVFLLAGAVVNVAVAWGQVVFQDSERITWTEVGTHIEKGPDQSYLFLRREPFGFPCWSFTRDRLIAVRTTVESPWIGTSRKTYVPLRPIGLLFAINTLFYAAVLWLLICGPFVVRRFIRVRRGLCPKCAYPMGQSDVCSECGKALPARAERGRLVGEGVPTCEDA